MNLKEKIILLFCRLRSKCILPQCCLSIPPCFQGLILGLLTASLALIVVIILWLKPSTMANVTTQISTGKLLFCLNDLQKTDKFLIESNCCYCLPYVQIELYSMEMGGFGYFMEAVFRTGFDVFPVDLERRISMPVLSSVFSLRGNLIWCPPPISIIFAYRYYIVFY